MKQIPHISEMLLALLLFLKAWGQSISKFLPHSSCEFDLDIDQAIFELGKDGIDLVLALIFLPLWFQMRILQYARLFSKRRSLFGYVFLNGLASNSLNEVSWFFLSENCLSCSARQIFFIGKKRYLSVTGGEAKVPTLVLLTNLLENFKTVYVPCFSHCYD